MSYLSRLYNHRNAQTQEGKKEQPFFSKKNNDKKGSKGAFFQAKLSVNEPGDQHEQEADAVADAVVSKKAAGPVLQQKKISSVQRLATSAEDEQLGTNDARMKHDKDIQRVAAPEKDKEKKLQKMDAPDKEKDKLKNVQRVAVSDKEKEKKIQKMDASQKDEEATVQLKEGSNTPNASAQISSKIESTSGKGSPLPKNTLHEMNTSFGRDFSNVNIHHDNDAGAMNEELNARAFTHGNDIYFSKGAFNPEHTEGKHLLAHELTHVVQQGESKKEDSVQRDTKTTKKSMLDQFAEKFPDSIDIIKKSPEALALIKDASDAGVEFGGFSEEGPVKDKWPYTSGKKVYVPKAHKADKITAASDFLFELNNGINSPSFRAVEKEAAKGSKGTMDAKTYAKKIIEVEVDGMLRLGKVWVDMKANKPKDENWNSHDNEFYLSEYESYKTGKKTKADIVKDVLSRTYTEGVDAGKTTEQFYMDQYNNIAKGK